MYGDERRPMQPSSPAIERLLTRLDPLSETAARECETVRERLIHFFDQRGSVDAESLADETLDCVARGIPQGGSLAELRAYCFGMAKRVWQEAAEQTPQ